MGDTTGKGSKGRRVKEKTRPVLRAVLALAFGAGMGTSATALQPGAREGPRPQARAADAPNAPWGRMAVKRGTPVDTRPSPPKAGRKRCIGVNAVAGAQLFGDRAIELTMRDGRRFRMFFARECQALSFYQGFYYRRSKAGQICAGRDVIGARSGGECPIASILPVRRIRS